MALDLDVVRSFLKVAELSSFTRASAQLGLSKSRISLQVQALEAQLGTRLFQRTTRTVRLTEDGEQFRVRANELLLDAEDLLTTFAAPSTLRGRLRVDLPVNIARDRIIPRLPEFTAVHPHLELLISATDRRVDLLREGFDCVLRVGPLGDSSLHVRRMGALAMVNVVSAGYAARNGVPASLADLERHTVVHYSSKLGAEPPGLEFHDGARYRDHAMRALLTVNSVDAYQAACLAGFGIAQVPRVSALDGLSRGALVEVLPELKHAPLQVSLVHGYGRSVPRRVRVFMDWLARVLAPYLATTE